MSLRIRLLILTLCLAIIPALSVGLASYNLTKSGIYREIKTKLAEETTLLKDQVAGISEASAEQMKVALKLFHNIMSGEVLMDVKILPDGGVSLDYTVKSVVFDGIKHSRIDGIASKMGKGYVATIFRVENGEA